MAAARLPEPGALGPKRPAPGRLIAAWSPRRTLSAGRRSADGLDWRWVDKPAGVECAGPGSCDSDGCDLEGRDSGGPDSDRCDSRGCELSAHLADAGWEAWRGCWPLSARCSGVVMLLPAGGPGPEGQLRPRFVFRLVVGTSAPDRALQRSARDAEPLSFRQRDRCGSRVMLEALGEGDSPAPLIERIRRACRVVGDGGEPCTRLLIHVEAAWPAPESRSRKSIRSRLRSNAADSAARIAAQREPCAHAPLPAEFDAWLHADPQRPVEQFESALLDALPIRYAISQRHDAHRLLSEHAGEIQGLTVDRYGDYALVAASTEEAWSQRERLAQCLLDHGAHGVYFKRRARTDLRRSSAEALSPSGPVAGLAAPEPLPIQQGPLQVAAWLGEGHSTGVFLDQRSAWFRFGESCFGKSLLNLFCYTGLFTLAAANAGARATTNVDLSKAALGRLRQHLDRNGLSGPHHRLLAADAVGWLARAARRGDLFDRVVLDPPSFGTQRRQVLRLDRDWVPLVEAASGLMAPGGQLLCVNHQRGLDWSDLAASAQQAAERSGPGGPLTLSAQVGDWDCPTLPGVSATKSVLVQWREPAGIRAP